MPSWKDIREHEVTDERWFWSRRSVIQSALALGLAPNAIAADILRSERGQGKDDAPSWLTEKIKRAIPETDPLRQSEEPALLRSYPVITTFMNLVPINVIQRLKADRSSLGLGPFRWRVR